MFESDVEFSRGRRFVYACGLVVNDIHEPAWQCLPGWLSICQSHIGVHTDNLRVMPRVHHCRIHWARAYHIIGIQRCSNLSGKTVVYIGQKFCKRHWRQDVLHMGQVPRTVLAVVGSQ